MVYPTSSMGAHVSAVPNHQCRRTTSLQMRGDVALCGGGFGFELDVTAMSAEEKEQSKAVIARVKELRELVQKGSFRRLLSPFEGEYAAWEFLSGDGSQALLCAYRILSVANTPPIRIRMTGLDPAAYYRDDTGKVHAGASLMQIGYHLRLDGDFSSRVILLEKV